MTSLRALLVPQLDPTRTGDHFETLASALANRLEREKTLPNDATPSVLVQAALKEAFAARFTIIADLKKDRWLAKLGKSCNISASNPECPRFCAHVTSKYKDMLAKANERTEGKARRDQEAVQNAVSHFDSVRQTMEHDAISTNARTTIQLLTPKTHLTGKCFRSFREKVLAWNAPEARGKWAATRRVATPQERADEGVVSTPQRRYYIEVAFEPKPKGDSEESVPARSQASFGAASC